MYELMDLHQSILAFWTLLSSTWCVVIGPDELSAYRKNGKSSSVRTVICMHKYIAL